MPSGATYEWRRAVREADVEGERAAGFGRDAEWMMETRTRAQRASAGSSAAGRRCSNCMVWLLRVLRCANGCCCDLMDEMRSDPDSGLLEVAVAG